MNAFRNVVFWFVGLLVITVVGFWQSYFGILFQRHPFSHHFHGIVMTLWVVLLIAQAGLVRTRRLDLHRSLGRASFVVAPLAVVAGIVVNLDFLRRVPDPADPFIVSLYWFGWFLPIAFAVLYALAMVYRKDFQLHARYMIGTGVIFLFPGLGRSIGLFAEPEFYDVLILVGVLCVGLIAWDRWQGKIRAPFLVLAGLWGLNLVLWHLLPAWQGWQAFTAWSAELVS